MAAEFTLTVFEPDDATPLFEVGTASDHDFPFLHVLAEFDEAEVDLENGKALIGQYNLRVIDPQTGATQVERFLTALLGNAAGFSALNGSRMLLQQVSPTTEVRLDGVGYGVTLSDTFAGFSLQLRDIRERGRKVSAFLRSGTTSLLPRGVLGGYGLLPTGEYLVPPTTPLHGTYHNTLVGILDTTGKITLDGAPAKPGATISAALVVTDAMLGPLGHTAVVAGATFPGTGYQASIYDQVSVLWRAEGGGGAWTVLSRMSSLFDQGRGIVQSVAAKVKTPDGGVSEVRGATQINVSNSGLGTLPTDGARVEVVIRYDGPPTEAYPFHYEGSWGTFVANLLAGDYCGLDESGTPVNPRIRYDADLLTDPAGPFAIPIRVRRTEPTDDLRSVLEELCKAIGAAPALNADGEIAPVRYAVPDASVTLAEINDSNAQAIPGWGHPADNAVTVVEVTYPRDFYIPPVEDPNGERAAGDSLGTRDVTIRRAPDDLVAALGEQELKIDAWMFRALGGTEGQPFTGDHGDEAGAQVAVERQHQALDRFGYGGVTSFVRLRVEDFPDLAPGDWVLDARSWRPNYQTGERGGNALAQVVSVKRRNPAWWEARLIDAGPADMPLGQPTLGTITVDEEGVVSVPVNAVPTGGEARVDYALSSTLPANTSPLWILLGRTDATGTLTSPALPADTTVWIRSRGEAVGRRPSAWTNAVSVTTPPSSRALFVYLTVDDETGEAVVRWTVNGSTAALRIYYATHDPTVSASFSPFTDVVATAGSFTLPVTPDRGEAVSVRVDPWSGWTGSAVTGTPGASIFRTAIRAVDPTIAVLYPDGVIVPFLDLAAGFASANTIGNRVVRSVKIVASKTAEPTESAVRAATAINARNAPQTSVSSLVSGCVFGDVVRYAAFFYDEEDAGGNESEVVRVNAKFGVGADQLEDGSLTGSKFLDATLVANKLTESSRSFISDITFGASDNNTVTWTSGTITFAGGSTYSISSGNTGDMGAETLIYFDPSVSTTTLQTTTSFATATGERRVLIAYARPIADALQKAAYVPAVGILGLNGDNLQANSIKANHIQADEINANHITSIHLSVIQALITDLSAINGTFSGTLNAQGSVTVDVDAGQRIYFKQGGVVVADIAAGGTGGVSGVTIGLGFGIGAIFATNLFRFSEKLQLDDDLLVVGSSAFTGLVETNGGITMEDGDELWFKHPSGHWNLNSGNSTTDLYFSYNSAPKTYIDSGGNLFIKGTYQFFSPEPPKPAAEMTPADWLEWGTRDVLKPNWPGGELPNRDHVMIRAIARDEHRAVDTVLAREVARYSKDAGAMAWGAAGYVRALHSAILSARNLEHLKELIGA